MESTDTCHALSVVEERNEEIEPVELFFTPHAMPEIDFNDLGLLGKMVSSHCLLEYFRLSPIEVEICKCIRKLFVWHEKLQEQHAEENQEKEPLSDEALPNLWIITTSVSDKLLDIFNAINQPLNWCQGVYLTEEGFKTGIVVIDRLPTTIDTLWLRLLGLGEIQREVVSQLIALPTTNLLRQKVLNFIGNWWLNTREEEELTEELEEMFAILLPIYQQWQTEQVD